MIYSRRTWKEVGEQDREENQDMQRCVSDEVLPQPDCMGNFWSFKHNGEVLSGDKASGFCTLVHQSCTMGGSRGRNI